MRTVQQNFRKPVCKSFRKLKCNSFLRPEAARLSGHTTDASNGTLVIRGVGAEDAGAYTCRATDNRGRADQQTFTLTVVGECISNKNNKNLLIKLT